MRLLVHLPLLACWTTLLASAPAGFAQTVTAERWGDRKEEHFDPRHPPGDLPLLAKKEVALASARPWVEWKAEPSRGKWDRKSHTLTVEAVGDVTLHGHTDLQLPDDATSALRAHEIGHDEVNAAVWERITSPLVKDALKGINGLTFSGEGADDEARGADAWKKADAEYARRMSAAIAEINRQLDQAGEQFDEATDHGRSKTVDAERGVEMVAKKRAAATRSSSR